MSACARRSHDPPMVTIGCCRTKGRPGDGAKDSEQNILETGCGAPEIHVVIQPCYCGGRLEVSDHMSMAQHAVLQGVHAEHDVGVVPGERQPHLWQLRPRRGRA